MVNLAATGIWSAVALFIESVSAAEIRNAGAQIAQQEQYRNDNSMFFDASAFVNDTKRKADLEKKRQAAQRELDAEVGKPRL